MEVKKIETTVPNIKDAAHHKPLGDVIGEHKDRLKPETIKKLNEVSEWIIKTHEGLRRDSLTAIAENNGWSYENTKHWLNALHYATSPHHLSGEVTLSKIPKSYQSKVKGIIKAINEGSLDVGKCKKAGELFYKHSPSLDIERFHRLTIKFDNEFVEKAHNEMIDEQVKITEEIEKTLTLGLEHHKGYARSLAWKFVGKNINYFMPKLIRKTPEKILDVDLITFDSYALKMLKSVSEELKAKALFLSFAKEHEGLSEAEKKTLQGLTYFSTDGRKQLVKKGDEKEFMKNLRKMTEEWTFPGGESSEIPSQLKSALIYAYLMRNRQREESEFHKELVAIGEHIYKANQLHKDAKKTFKTIYAFET
jgi:hypothetical protein